MSAVAFRSFPLELFPTCRLGNSYICATVCVCVFFYMLHSEDQPMYVTSNVRILAGPQIEIHVKESPDKDVGVCVCVHVCTST